jgi:hypothetical protein
MFGEHAKPRAGVAELSSDDEKISVTAFLKEVVSRAFRCSIIL